MKKLLVKNIGLLATPEGKSAHRGEEQGKIKFLKDAWVLIEDGIIASVGTGAVPAVEGAEVVDAEGHLVTPGLVDAHTHLIFGGWRQNELGLKLHGASYLDIQNAGGGTITLLFFCINIERILSHSHLLTAMQEHFNSQYHVWTVSTISRRICHICKIGQMIVIANLAFSYGGWHSCSQSPLKFTI